MSQNLPTWHFLTGRSQSRGADGAAEPKHPHPLTVSASVRRCHSDSQLRVDPLLGPAGHQDNWISTFSFFFFLLTTSKHEIVFLTVPTLLSSACEVCLEASCGGASPLTSLLGAPLEVRGGINMGLNSSPPTVGVCHFCQSSSECLSPLRAK